MGQNVTYTSNAHKQSGHASHVWSDAMIKPRDNLNAAGVTSDKARGRGEVVRRGILPTKQWHILNNKIKL